MGEFNGRKGLCAVFFRMTNIQSSQATLDRSISVILLFNDRRKISIVGALDSLAYDPRVMIFLLVLISI